MSRRRKEIKKPLVKVKNKLTGFESCLSKEGVEWLLKIKKDEFDIIAGEWYYNTASEDYVNGDVYNSVPVEHFITTVSSKSDTESEEIIKPKSKK